MNYFGSAIGNDILSVYYQIGRGICRNSGERGSALFSLQIKHLYVGQFQYETMIIFAEEINATMNLSYLPPKFLKKGCKNLPPYFFHGALLHRLYDVDAPALNGTWQKRNTRR